MRDLYEEIQEYYALNEALSKEPSSPIETKKFNNNDNETNHFLSTKLTRYESRSNPGRGEEKSIHTVEWHPSLSKSKMTPREKSNTLHDALHLHNHFINHHTQVNDVVRGQPYDNTDDSGIPRSTNKRANIYTKKAGFGKIDQGNQYGVVKQHPNDHPEEHLRGKKYLHPIEDYTTNNIKTTPPNYIVEF